jgi:hypothetical protein
VNPYVKAINRVSRARNRSQTKPILRRGGTTKYAEGRNHEIYEIHERKEQEGHEGRFA